MCRQSKSVSVSLNVVVPRLPYIVLRIAPWFLASLDTVTVYMITLRSGASFTENKVNLRYSDNYTHACTDRLVI